MRGGEVEVDDLWTGEKPVHDSCVLYKQSSGATEHTSSHGKEPVALDK